MPESHDQHVRVCGKFFDRGGKPWLVKGLTYGPFGPSGKNGGLPEPSRVRFDLDSMIQAGANTVRVFELPPEWFLDECAKAEMKVMISIPWTCHVDFLRERGGEEKARDAVRETVSRYRGHEAVFAYLVGNEIEGTLVRWMGGNRVREFLDSLCLEAKEADEDTLVSYGNYPTTEFLQPQEADFCAFNVYLETRHAYAAYLARLQHIANEKPLLITEFGADSKSLGESQQAQILGWALEEGAKAGLAGTMLFAFTDEWYRGHPVHGWDFGIVRRAREPKAAFSVLMDTWKDWVGPTDGLQLEPIPKVSVIVCTHNGSVTIGPCLDSLLALDYGDFEILVVDDGSTDETRKLVDRRDGVQLIRQDHGGLSAARNRGAKEAKGEILAYTDDDCLVEKDWLTHVVAVMEREELDACGGPNLPPPSRNPVEALVAIAPGAPVHVMVDDRRAEHIPGCNLFVRRNAFEKLNGFREEYVAAGDDVDFCWRLRENGIEIGFAPAGFVWHHRRASIRAYLRQQAGYGRAEKLLAERHPDRFGYTGGALWRGAIYEPNHLSTAGTHGSRLFRGMFGNALFPVVYARPASDWFNVFTSVPWVVLALALLVGSLFQPWLLFAVAGMVVCTLHVTGRRAFEYQLPPEARGWKSRASLIGMCVAQPVVRSFTRFSWRRARGTVRRRPSAGRFFRWPRLSWRGKAITEMSLWSEKRLKREDLLERMRLNLEKRGHRYAMDDGWRDWDVELRDSRFWKLQLTSVTEYHGDKERLVRLRFSSHATRMHIAGSALLGGLIGYIILTAASPFRMLWLVGLWVAWWFFLELHHRGRIEQFMTMARQVAYDLGFDRVKSETIEDPAD